MEDGKERMGSRYEGTMDVGMRGRWTYVCMAGWLVGRWWGGSGGGMKRGGGCLPSSYPLVYERKNLDSFFVSDAGSWGFFFFFS